MRERQQTWLKLFLVIFLFTQSSFCIQQTEELLGQGPVPQEKQKRLQKAEDSQEHMLLPDDRKHLQQAGRTEKKVSEAMKSLSEAGSSLAAPHTKQIWRSKEKNTCKIQELQLHTGDLRAPPRISL